jgi:hypothetical protein
MNRVALSLSTQQSIQKKNGRVTTWVMQNAPAMHVMMLLGECYDASLLHFQRKHSLVCASDFNLRPGTGRLEDCISRSNQAYNWEQRGKRGLTLHASLGADGTLNDQEWIRVGEGGVQYIAMHACKARAVCVRSRKPRAFLFFREEERNFRW